MNLFYLAHKRDPNLVLSEKVSIGIRRTGNDEWRGLGIQPASEPQIRIRTATAWHPFRTRAETIGWFATATGEGAVIRLAFVEPGTDRVCGAWTKLNLGQGWSAVRLPWSLESTAHLKGLDLLVHVPASSQSSVFVGCHRALDRRRAIELCVGRGIELGPGPKPQVLSGPGVEVSYVEEMSPQDWRDHYGRHYRVEVDDALWRQYQVGRAHEIPAPDGSLDFIFSSHVFEHLVNPLGHLGIWSSKLRAGGKVVAVVPDLAGTKDYAAQPTPLSEFLSEFEAASYEPARAHYSRFAAVRGIADGGERLWANRSSVHVHFYSHANMADLMEQAVNRFGYQGFSILHTANHKDFYVVLVR